MPQRDQLPLSAWHPASPLCIAQPWIALPCIALLLAFALGCHRSPPEETTDDDALTGALAGRVFIMVVADSLHAQHLSAYGYDRPTSPFIERLAETGIRARRALSQTCWTLSSVMSLFTGLGQERHGIILQTQKVGREGPPMLAEMFKAAGYRAMAYQENPAASRRIGVGRGFDDYRMRRFDLGRASQTIESAHSDINEALKEGGKPLFLYVHLLTPHMPYTPPEPFASLYRDVEESRVTGSIRDVATIQARGLPEDGPEVQRLIETYDAHVTYADERIRLLLEPFMESHGDRLCVLFTSDHGEGFMQHGGTGHNTLCNEEMVSVPWILSAPGALPAGVEIPGVVSVLDVVPTVAQLFGLKLPARRLDGTSLVGTFAGVSDGALASAPAPRELYLSSRYKVEDGETWCPQRALVEGPWKFIAQRREGRRFLFNTDEDPLEKHDLLSVETDRAKRMGARLDELVSLLGEESVSRAVSPLDGGAIRDLEALGYGGEQLEVPGAQK